MQRQLVTRDSISMRLILTWIGVFFFFGECINNFERCA